MLFTADRIQSVVFVCVYLPGSSCYSSSHLCCGVCFLCTTFLLDCVLGELIWLENIPFSELLVILNWDKLMIQFITWSDEEQHWHCWGSAVWAAVSFCLKWWLKEMLVTLVSVAFHVGANQSDVISSEREELGYSFIALHGTYMFCIPHLFQCLLQNNLVFCRILYLAHHP